MPEYEPYGEWRLCLFISAFPGLITGPGKKYKLHLIVVRLLGAEKIYYAFITKQQGCHLYDQKDCNVQDKGMLLFNTM